MFSDLVGVRLLFVVGVLLGVLGVGDLNPCRVLREPFKRLYPLAVTFCKSLL